MNQTRCARSTVLALADLKWVSQELMFTAMGTARRDFSPDPGAGTIYQEL